MQEKKEEKNRRGTRQLREVYRGGEFRVENKRKHRQQMEQKNEPTTESRNAGLSTRLPMQTQLDWNLPIVVLDL